ncbi:MAG: hypothetical protein AAFY47_01690 [Pseudomonadota bacterium]
MIWILAVLVVATVTAGAQLDRQARYVPTLTPLIPEPFRAFSQRHAAAQALLDDKPELALLETRRLVARRPMPASHLRLLSIAEFEAGNVEQGSYAIQLAARRGWRDGPAQRSMLQLALAAGDEAEAARRFAALFVKPDEEQADLNALAQEVFAPGQDNARAVFAQIVAEADRWHSVYLRKAPAVLSSDALIDITKRASQAGAAFDCAEARRTAERLGKRDDAASQAFAATIVGC